MPDRSSGTAAVPAQGAHAADVADLAAQLVPPELMPHERITQGLVAEDASVRLSALAAALQPNAPIDRWARELVACVDLSRADETLLQLAATAFCTLVAQPSRDVALPCVVTLATVENALPVRLAAAHCFWLYKCVPAPAWPSVSQMVFSTDPGLRKIAFAAALPHAEAGAADIAAAAAKVGAAGWTIEGLDLLAASAGKAESKQRQVEDFVLRTLRGETNIALLVAGYAALARLNPSGLGVSALAQVAGSALQWSDSMLALTALSQLEKPARAAIPALVKQLVETDDPAREEALCHTLLLLQISDREVPIARTLQRIESGPDQAVAAHCIFLSLHAKPFARAAPVLASRATKSSETLVPLLSAVHEMLTGKPIAAVVAANKT